MGRTMALEGRDLLWLQSVLIRLSFEDFPVVLRAGALELISLKIQRIQFRLPDWLKNKVQHLSLL